MRARAPDVPEQVVQFAPKEKTPRNTDDALDQAGEATISLVQRAANLSNERCDRLTDLAHQLSLKLRAAEDRIRQFPRSLRAGRRVAQADLPRG